MTTHRPPRPGDRKNHRSDVRPQCTDPASLREGVRAHAGEVRYEGACPTREKAEEAVHLVLSGLGRQLTGDERVDLAARLPVEAARILTAQIPDTQPLGGWAFVKDLAARTGASLATTRWDTGSVFSAVAAYAGPDLITRILRRLPSGYALLFGRAELTRAA